MDISTVEPQELAELSHQQKKIDVIDVRTPGEYQSAHIPMAMNVPLDQLDPAKIMDARNGSRNELLYVICQAGVRGRKACEQFLAAGFTNVVNVEGGTKAWMDAGLPVVQG